ncbi:MAG TPA: rod shape-determining protein RodA [Stellaceae bacterium]|jgi:rod shape determining protein RodA|nr:rod shape-determining protein RodA [Stellaceae bacterium]
MASISPDLGHRELTFVDRLRGIRWGLIALITAIACLGFATLYSAANGNLQPWSEKQMTRFAFAFVPMIAAALIDIRHWFRLAYWIYGLALVLVVAVDLHGLVGLGAQRWINLGFMQLQPSEVMKVAMVLALAHYFHALQTEEVGRVSKVVVPVVLIVVPVGLVLKQPDLGTAVMLLVTGGVVLFLAGVRLWMFAVGLAAAAGIAPLAWSMLRGYQKARLYTFLDPNTDPLGAGYHILQSKIALGSGGLFGKGFLEGTQTHLSFLPEKQTDFIFTIIAEEFGLIGGLALLALYAIVITYCFAIALRSRNHFGRLLGLGLATNFFLYVFINTAMVIGLLPVVGVPLPLISYGGTAMVTVMLGFGLLMNVSIHRDVRISRLGESQLG